MHTNTATIVVLLFTLGRCAFSDDGTTLFADHFRLTLPETSDTRMIPLEWMEVGAPVTIESSTGLVSRIERNNMFLPSLIQLSELKLFACGGYVSATICQFPSQEAAFQSAIIGISESSMNSGELLAHYSYETNYPGICLCWHDQKGDVDGSTMSRAIIIRGNLTGYFSGLSGTNLLNVADGIMNATPICQPR